MRKLALVGILILGFSSGIACSGSSFGQSTIDGPGNSNADSSNPSDGSGTNPGSGEGSENPGGSCSGDNCGETPGTSSKSVCERAEHLKRKRESNKTASKSTDSKLLERNANVRAAYSLRKIRSSYNGPVVRVRRSSDNKTRDFGFDDTGWIDTTALKDFIGDGNGRVVKWYAQSKNTPDLMQKTAKKQPYIVKEGTLHKEEGNPTIHFASSSYLESGKFENSIPLNDYTFWGVVHTTKFDGETEVFGIGTLDHKHWLSASYRLWQSYLNHASNRFGDEDGSIVFGQFNVIFLRNNGQRADIWQGNTQHASETAETSDSLDAGRAKSRVSVGGGFTGNIGEFAVYPRVKKETLYDFYASIAKDWKVGPAEWNKEAILPQQHEYQVTLYDWLEKISVDDVRLPDGELKVDLDQLNEDQLADLWLETEKLTASSVTRAEPEWYVLDAGERGIEATGKVKVWHEPKGSRGYGGNPPRSWANEPAYLYQLDLPLANGEQGNPYYENPAIGKRALVVAMVDMMMHAKHWNSSSFGWYDMFGKAALSWAETYRWTKELLPLKVRKAFETGMGHALDRMISIGPRAVNTNMDMFAVQAQADFAAATDDPIMECKAVRAARSALLGYEDGKLGEKHKLFAAGDRDGGVFDPAGFIMEGGQPDVFYGGESIYHLAGALAAVTDRETGEVPEEWKFLDEVVRRLQEWRTYQMFYDPGRFSPGSGGKDARKVWTAGAGFAARTSYGVPSGQAGEIYKHLFIAARYPDFSYKAELPGKSKMKEKINGAIDYVTGELKSNYEGAPSEWSGWSPWAKKTPYVPSKGWYSDLKQMKESNEPKAKKPPVAREGVSYNKAFGGHPMGKSYWAYKDASGEQTWGFFVEAQPRQGGYGGWYGGKIETFWTKKTGVVLINRHGKSGCDRSGVDDYSANEDSTCWFNLERKAGHHVWGRDDDGKGFTTLLLRGRNLERTSDFDIDSKTPTVRVKNHFNDPSLDEGSSKTGEQTGKEIQGELTVENAFKANSEGLEVTHHIRSDGSDEVKQLWASVPVYLRHRNPHRAGDNWHLKLDDTSIEYWTGNDWETMRVDSNDDGVPDLKKTQALRLGRNYERGDGPQYVYVDFASEQRTRLSTGKYYDPYQSKTGVRTVHIDLHGNPGSTKQIPENRSVTYTLRPTSPID